ncbi:MAG: 3-hydroxybutyryl-CoA dehydratase [Nocardia sp.]|uniref:thioesterase family protein n=1 Tax=Nocardia sp. TaxID=1821 RepID=UPI002620829A|nr:thioesterase family protein [Nocardia sp.]MCU1648420.1 3-hydroxybutyryl-CoA dehydratase [Nocardia sp.]
MVAFLPAFTQVLELPRGFGRVIPPEFEDGNGHMNVMHYYGLHGEGLWQTHRDLGYRSHTGKFGSFAKEQHVKFLREVLVGHEVSVHIGHIGRTAKVLHGVSYLLNLTTSEVANSFEFLAVNIDLATRRPAPFPEDVAELLDGRIAAAAACGIGPEYGVLELRTAPAV